MPSKHSGSIWCHLEPSLRSGAIWGKAGPSGAIQGHLELLSPEDISSAVAKANMAINAGEGKHVRIEEVPTDSSDAKSNNGSVVAAAPQKKKKKKKADAEALKAQVASLTKENADLKKGGGQFNRRNGGYQGN